MEQANINDMHGNKVKKGKKRWKYNFYLSTFFRGLIVSLPIVLLLLLLSFLLKLVFNFVSPISYLLDPKSAYTPWIINAIALIILLGLFFVVGLFVRNRSSRNFFKYFEKEYLCQVPLYTTLRDLIQQFTGLKEMPFSQVVLVDPFNSGVLMTGFITEKIGDDMTTVFVPTAPNPTNGFIFHVPNEKVKYVDVPAESAIRTVISLGTGSSCLFVEDKIPKDKK